MIKIDIKNLRPNIRDKIKTVNKKPLLLIMLLFAVIVFLVIMSFVDIKENKNKAGEYVPREAGTAARITDIEILKNAPTKSIPLPKNEEEPIENENPDKIDICTNNTKEEVNHIEEYFHDMHFKGLQEQAIRETKAFLSGTNVNIGQFKIESFPGLHTSDDNNIKQELIGSNRRIFPKTKFELHPGTTIPAILVTGINSQLPGMITAMVSENVYDSATGRYLLIPKGSKLVGAYKSDILTGQNRIMAAWNRINFPDGSYLNFNNMSASDQAGLSGLKDKVNNHYFRIFSHAALLSFISAGVSLTQEDLGSDASKFHESLSRSLGQNLGQVATDIIRKQMNIQPTIDIRAGYKFVVMVSEDVVFENEYS